jgi:uncharacterized protein (DUF58 family)
VVVLDDHTRKKIKQILIKTKRMMNSTVFGDYSSAFKGSGLEFNQLREYVPGDDVRFIDWNSSAKMNKIMVKEFVEERDRTIILAVDVSASTKFSSSFELKSKVIAQFASTIAFISNENKDKVGAVFFSDKIEKWLPPKKNRSNYFSILKSILTIQSSHSGTCIGSAIEFLNSLKKRNSIIFIISDWIDDEQVYLKPLKSAAIRHEVIGVRLLDSLEKSFPKVGFLDVYDPESGEVLTVNSSQINKFLLSRLDSQEKLLKKAGVGVLDLQVDKDFIDPVVRFFRQRIHRQI